MRNREGKEEYRDRNKREIITNMIKIEKIIIGKIFRLIIDRIIFCKFFEIFL